MLISPNIAVDWTQKIKSESRLLDLLGIWTHHLNFQEEFTKGITSVTRRARYYTILAYYYQYLWKKNVIDPADFEKIFILSSLAHHDGDTTSPALIHMYNIRKFINDWDKIDLFTLDFDINGFGRIYYNRQMEVFRCVWTDDFGMEHLSKMNKKLADTLSFLNPENFALRSLSKDQLTTLFDGFCICCISENRDEIEILSQLMFGFFSENGGTADIDEVKFSEFTRSGNLDLEFADISPQKTDDSLRGQNARRRNTLFLFLQIIAATSPNISELNRFIWDAIYFRQNRETKENIEFNELEKTRKYWEFFQLNVYYVFLLEKILDEINDIVVEKIGINKRKLITTLNIPAIFAYLSNRLNCTIDKDTSMTALFDAVELKIKNSQSSLKCELNESDIYDRLIKNKMEPFFSECFILLGLLKIRYENSQFVIQSKSISALASLNIEDLLGYLKANGDSESLEDFLSKLMQTIVNKHLFVAVQRFAYGTRNWIFVEEDERLYSTSRDVRINPRDNRWGSIRSILTDLGFIFQNHDQLEDEK